jgi:hypothetical protein
MLQIVARKRLAFVSLFVLTIALLVLKFGPVSKAGESLPPLPLMTSTSSTSIIASAIGGAASDNGSKVGHEVIADTANGRSASVLIYLADQADVSAAYKMKDQDARGWYVYKTLSEHAARTQTGIKALLDSQGVTYQSFWAANMILAEVNRPLVDTLVLRSDVARIDSNKTTHWIEDPAIADYHDSTNKGEDPETTEWGVNNVNAPAVWAMGFTGQGIVLGDLDTGTRWTHVALKPKYRWLERKHRPTIITIGMMRSTQAAEFAEPITLLHAMTAATVHTLPAVWWVMMAWEIR